MPQRLQHHTNAGVPVPEGALRITPSILWVAPFFCGPGDGRTAKEQLTAFRAHLREHPEQVEKIRADLAGFDLVDDCEPGQPCLLDVLLPVAAGQQP